MAPSGYFIVLREQLGAPGWWIVRILDFATWKHREVEFESEEAARRYFTLWTL